VSPQFTIASVTGLPTNENSLGDNNGASGPNNFPDNQVDQTIDFGFKQSKVAIGNRVWADTDKSGAMNGSETGIDGVTVQLYRDADGDGTCEPGGDDGSVITSTTTSGGGYYQFLGLTPTDGNDPKTNYCVVIPKSGIPSQYKSSSSGWTSNPDTTDEGSGQGDDAYPSGSYVVARPLKATLEGQTGTDVADAPGYSDKSSYFTVDFGFHTDDTPANAVALSRLSAHHADVWGIVMALLLLVTGAAIFQWRRRQSIQ
jgi:hypothetical protein